MPYHWNYPKVPDIAKIGTGQHRTAIKHLYRRTLKAMKYNSRFRYDVWDFQCMRTREHFEKCRTMDDSGEVTRLMKELEVCLDTFEDPDMYVKPWDGPRGTAFNRYPPSPAKRFEHRVADGTTYYDQAWVDDTTEEWFVKQEIEKQRARYITVFRDATLNTEDYPQWLAIKKRLEEELKYRIEDIQSTMGKTWMDWLWDWPYNPVVEFSDGYKPDWKLDIAMQNHWDEELWRRVAELEEPEKEALDKYQWSDSGSPRTIDKFLPK
eukprot:489900_1